MVINGCQCFKFGVLPANSTVPSCGKTVCTVRKRLWHLFMFPLCNLAPVYRVRSNGCERFNTELVGLTQKNNQEFSWAHLAKCFKCHRRSDSSYSQRARCPALGTIWKRWGGWGEKEGGMESLTFCLTLLRVIIMSGRRTLCRRS